MVNRIQLEVPLDEGPPEEASSPAFNADVRFDSPEAVNAGTVFSSGGTEVPELKSRVAEITQFDPDTGRTIPGTGFRWVYNTRTGEKVPVHRNRLASILRAKHKDPAYPELVGKPVFSLTQTVPRYRGITLCVLFPGVDKCKACGEAHPPHPSGWLHRIPGLKPCLSAHLANDYEATRHLLKKHSTAYDLIKEAQEQERRDGDRLLQHRALETQEALVKALTKQTK